MFTERTSVGLDVHARSVAAAAVDGVTGEVFRARLAPDSQVVLSWLSALPGPVAAAYEAGPTGYGLARAIRSAGTRCEVVAPSKLSRPPGDRVKMRFPPERGGIDNEDCDVREENEVRPGVP